jgi:hypothetical protein
MGVWLGVLSRGILGGLAGREGEGGARGEGAVEANRGTWNIVQANGACVRSFLAAVFEILRAWER